MYKGYTFCYHQRGTNRLQCSRRISTKCEARLKLDNSGIITFADTCHNHPPPIYMKTPNGTYVKVPNRMELLPPGTPVDHFLGRITEGEETII